MITTQICTHTILKVQNRLIVTVTTVDFCTDKHSMIINTKGTKNNKLKQYNTGIRIHIHVCIGVKYKITVYSKLLQ